MASSRYTSSHRSSHSTDSTGSYDSTSSNDSAHTQHTASTAPTSYSDHKPVAKHYGNAPSALVYGCTDEQLHHRNDSRSSVATYASTTASIEEAEDEEQHASHKEYAANVISSTPSEFAQLFPSTRRMTIRHDATVDGNMNLRVDTAVDHMLNMTLFHLRMQDLRERKFSLRRYCRESGREICTSNKKYMKPSLPERRRRPSFQRSLSSALQSLGVKAVPTTLRRSSSAHDSESADDLATFRSDEKATVPTNIIKLEFSNYAQVEVERQKTKTDRRWAFEYWGNHYHWSRSKHSTSYHLVNSLTGKATAQITPEVLSKRELEAETSSGSWCPPCSMTITDRNVSDLAKTDLADVIVATGLIALTDDSIRRLAQ